MCHAKNAWWSDIGTRNKHCRWRWNIANEVYIYWIMIDKYDLHYKNREKNIQKDKVHNNDSTWEKNIMPTWFWEHLLNCVYWRHSLLGLKISPSDVSSHWQPLQKKMARLQVRMVLDDWCLGNELCKSDHLQLFHVVFPFWTHFVKKCGTTVLSKALEIFNLRSLLSEIQMTLGRLGRPIGILI